MNYNKNCKKGKHLFINIHRCFDNDNSELVVRWCKNCGSVIVDCEYDNRVNSGYYLDLQTPKIAKFVLEEKYKA